MILLHNVGKLLYFPFFFVLFLFLYCLKNTAATTAVSINRLVDQSAFYYIDWWVIISAVFPTAVIYLPYPPPSFGEVVKAVSPLSSFGIIQLLALRCCHFVMHGSGLGAHCWPVILFHTSVLLNYLVSGGKFSILWGLYYLCLFVVLFVGSLGGWYVVSLLLLMLNCGSFGYLISYVGAYL